MSDTLSIKSISKGLEKIRKLGHTEETFEVLGTPITIRTLKRSELEASNNHCRPLFEDAQNNEDAFSLTSWVQHVKQESLTYSIMTIGDLDFHGINYVSTGEIDEESGREIRVQKHVFVRGILEGWEESTSEIIYKKFQEMTNKAAAAAGKDLVFEAEAEAEDRIQELEVEIEALKAQIKETKEEKVTTGGGQKIDMGVLKERAFTPVREGEEAAAPEGIPHDGYAYAEEPLYADAPDERPVRGQQEQRVEPPSGRDEARHLAEHKEEDGPSYVDAKNNPLSGEALEAAKENDRLFMEREAQRQRAQDLAAKRRKPLNTVDAKVTAAGQGEGPQTAPKATQNARPQAAPDDGDVVQLGGDNVEYLTVGQDDDRGASWGKPTVNPKPVATGNPRYQPPNK